MRPKKIATLVLLATAGLCVGCSAASTNGWPPKPSQNSSFSLSSEAFGNGQPIEQVYTMEAAGGRNVSPPLSWAEAPPKTRGFALEVVDMHPRANGWVHWLVSDIPAGEVGLQEDASAAGLPGTARQLTNGFGLAGWGGPQPPQGSGRHDYRFTVIAVDTPTLGLSADASLNDFRAAVKEHALDSASMVGTFQR